MTNTTRKLIPVAIPAQLGELSSAIDVASDASMGAGNKRDAFEYLEAGARVVQLLGAPQFYDPFAGYDSDRPFLIPFQDCGLIRQLRDIVSSIFSREGAIVAAETRRALDLAIGQL